MCGIEGVVGFVLLVLAIVVPLVWWGIKTSDQGWY